MPLINLQTNLKSLTYGEFGSESPFITKDINNPPNRKGLTLETGARIDDLARFSKFLISGKGVAWASKLGGLNVIEEGIKNSDRGLGGRLLGGGWSTIKQIASTTAQIPVNGTGTHFIEGFGGKRGYLKGIQGHKVSRTQGTIDGSNSDVRDLKQYLPFNDNADTVLIGSKILKKYVKRDRFGNTQKYMVDQLRPMDLSKPETDPSGIKNEFISNTFEPGLNEYSAQSIAMGSHTRNQEAAAVNNRSGQGFHTSTAEDEPYRGDAINMRSPFTSSMGDFVENYSNSKEKKKYKGYDLIKFCIDTVTPISEGPDGPLITRLDFRAYLDSFTDNFNSSWNGTQYIGRAEEMYSYGGFSRDISFGFKLVASSGQELIPMYKKLNALVGSTAPTYLGQNFMRGTFSRVTIGDYMNNLPGFIKAVNLTWNTDYTFASRGDDGGQQLPTILDVQIQYQPIHSQAPTNGNIFIGSKKLLKPEE